MIRNRIELIPVEALEPAAYNPREADETRLQLLGTSLKKLGFILPLYATPEGHLLSGHQRLTMARELGYTHVPVVRLDVPQKRYKNLNILFNRVTNDMKRNETSDDLWGELSIERIQELLEAIPDKVPNTPESYRCMRAAEMPISELVASNETQYESSAAGAAISMLREGIVMPVVRSASGRIVNGAFRIMAAGERQGRWGDIGDTYPTVVISDEEAEIARRLLNFISMRFTLHKQYADQLRYGAFRRANYVIEGMVQCLRFWPDGKRYRTQTEQWATQKKQAQFWRKFREEMGEDILDFGAGQRRSGDILVSKGVNYTAWEPYPVDWRSEVSDPDANKMLPSLALARTLTDEFLQLVAQNHHWSTIVISSVLNSVPFHFDRLCVLAIVHSLCNFDSQLVGSCRNMRVRGEGGLKVRDDNRVMNSGKMSAALMMFRLDYEPNVTIGDISVMPKVQKFYYQEEVPPLLTPFFEKTETYDCGSTIQFRGQAPKRVNMSVLKTALKHEFNLPYPDGQTLDRVEQALAAFGERFKVDFSKIPDAPKPEHA